MIHTSNWQVTHYDSLLYTLGNRVGSAVYRFEIPDGYMATFRSGAQLIMNLLESGTVALRYGSSNDPLDAPSVWSDSWTGVTE